MLPAMSLQNAPSKYEFKLFLRKRDRHELLLQRSRTLFSNLLMEKPLHLSGNFLLFGYNVQVVASDMPAKPKRPDQKQQYGLAMSSLVTASQVDYIQNIAEGCLMTLSPITTPCCRNTFVILSALDEKAYGQKINFGDEFFLKAENYGDPAAPPLYVRYTPQGTPAPKDVMPLSLSASKDTNCRFSAFPLYTSDYLELLGNPVKECGVTCRNFKDIHKRYTAENVFKLVSDIETKSQNK